MIELCEQLERFRLQCLALLAPIRALPSEILSEIFHHVKASSAANGVRPNARDVTVALTFVCRRWRAVAAADRRLWTCIDASYSRTQPAHPLITQRILAYSSDLPLDVRLWLPSHTGALADAHAALCSHHRRWRRVDADVFRFGAFLGRHGPAGGMPLLEHLLVHNSHTEEEELAHVLPAPRLRSLALHSPWPFLCAPTTPWTQLTAYSGPAVVDGLVVLPLLVNVETCDLLGRMEDAGDAWDEAVELPRLYALRVSDAAYLRSVAAPNLEVCAVPPDRRSFSSTVAFLERSRCASLTELRCGPVDCAELHSIVTVAPRLKTLGVFLEAPGRIRSLAFIVECRKALAQIDTLDFYLRAPMKDPGAWRHKLLHAVKKGDMPCPARIRIFGVGYDEGVGSASSSGVRVETYHDLHNEPFVDF